MASSHSSGLSPDKPARSSRGRINPNLGLPNNSLIHRSLRRISSIRRGGRGPHRLSPLLRVQNGLQLGRGLEAGVVRVLLVEVVLLLGAQLLGEVGEDALDEAVDGALLGRVAVPDGDEVRVEADGQADAAELVIC